MLFNSLVEFGDGSDWTLSKYLTHANRTLKTLEGSKLKKNEFKETRGLVKFLANSKF